MNDTINLFLNCNQHFANFKCITVSECCLIKLLQCILFNTDFGALVLLVGHQEEHPAGKKTERWGAGMVICLKQGADLHMTQLMPLPLTVSCFSKI